MVNYKGNIGSRNALEPLTQLLTVAWSILVIFVTKGMLFLIILFLDLDGSFSLCSRPFKVMDASG
jgi:hypothetical protein